MIRSVFPYFREKKINIEASPLILFKKCSKTSEVKESVLRWYTHLGLFFLFAIVLLFSRWIPNSSDNCCCNDWKVRHFWWVGSGSSFLCRNLSYCCPVSKKSDISSFFNFKRNQILVLYVCASFWQFQEYRHRSVCHVRQGRRHRSPSDSATGK